MSTETRVGKDVSVVEKVVDEAVKYIEELEVSIFFSKTVLPEVYEQLTTNVKFVTPSSKLVYNEVADILHSWFVYNVYAPARAVVQKVGLTYINTDKLREYAEVPISKLSSLPTLYVKTPTWRTYLPLIPIDLLSAIKLLANIDFVSKVSSTLLKGSNFTLLVNEVIKYAKKISLMALPKSVVGAYITRTVEGEPAIKTIAVDVAGRKVSLVTVHWRTGFNLVRIEFISRRGREVKLEYETGSLLGDAQSLAEILYLSSGRRAIEELYSGVKKAVLITRKAHALIEVMKKEVVK